MRIFSRILLLTALLSLTNLMVTQECWAADGGDTQKTFYQDTEITEFGIDDDMDEVSDPLEGWNRIMFTLNDILYFGVIRPISQVYEFIAPEMVRVAIRNFFHNLEMPKHFVGAFLQGDMEKAGRELGRFGINTVLGFGFFDTAEAAFGMSAGNEDIGQALGTMGASDSPYLVWPIIGPSNLRDTIGLAGDIALNPLTYYPKDEWARVGIQAGKLINNTSLRIGEYENLVEAALDPYIAIRDAYTKMRRKKISE
jgi:phospholipid-binding lipoprotein MlaA